MKDKLVKTGHKKAYYRLRRFGKVSLFLVLFAAAFATPVLVTYSMNAEVTVAEHPQEESSSEAEGSLPSFTL